MESTLEIAELAEGTHRINVLLSPGFVTLSNEGVSASGIEGGITVNYAYSNSWSAGGGYHQAFNISGFGNLYTQLSAVVSYALFGSLTREQTSTTVSGDQVLISQEFTGPAFVVTGGIKQYFFSGSESIFSLTGFGGSAAYRFGSGKSASYQVGAAFDLVGNSGTTITPMKFFVGTEFWF